MLMLIVHTEAVSIEISGIVKHVALAVDVLHEIVLLGHLEQQQQARHSGHELRVRAVHQLHAAHLFQRDGLHLPQEFFHRQHACQLVFGFYFRHKIINKKRNCEKNIINSMIYSIKLSLCNTKHVFQFSSQKTTEIFVFVAEK